MTPRYLDAPRLNPLLCRHMVGCRVYGAGRRVQGLRLRVRGLRCGVLGLYGCMVVWFRV